MNSSFGQNVSTVVRYPDSYSTALAKNLILVVLGIVINYMNGTFIHIFRKHQVFYLNPRYILFIHLVLNDMIQLTTTISLFVVSYVFYKINAPLCCIFIALAGFTTQNSPLNLAVMSVECYIAVCFPLRHADLCTVKRMYILIACIWSMSMMSILPDLFYSVATDPTILFSVIVCDIITFLQNSILVKKREVFLTMYLVGVWLVLFYTYIKIFLVARAAKTENNDAKKARNTILLHSFQLLLCMLTYAYTSVSRIFFILFPRIYLHLIFFWYILVHILPRFLSPMVYGLRDKAFRQHFKKHLFCICNFVCVEK